MTNKIGYVILHYLSIEDTEECVSSILNYSQQKGCFVIIVDNCSPNNSGKILCDNYKSDSRVKIIINDKNLGFSKGNNVGIKYARQVLGCDFVVALNNDTYLMDEKFEQIVIEEYQKSAFAVLGPKVYDPDSYNASNPGNCDLPTIKECRNAVMIWAKALIKSYFPIYNVMAHSINKKSEEIKMAQEKAMNRKEFCRLHGCCLVFSPLYFQYFSGFLERTFMYAEETILLINLRTFNLKSVYNPNLHIFHKEAVVSKKVLGNAKSHKKCWLMLKASIALTREMKKYLKVKENDDE